jgi:hypothetical protein
MKRRIKRIAPLQAGKMLGVLYACMGLIFLPFFALAGLAGALRNMLKKRKTLLVFQQRLRLESCLVSAFSFRSFME